MHQLLTSRRQRLSVALVAVAVVIVASVVDAVVALVVATVDANEPVPSSTKRLSVFVG
jgi:hypothetical protein